MAEDKDKDKPAEGAKKEAASGGEAGPKKSKGPVKLLAGVLALIGLGVLGAFLAMPRKDKEAPRFQGPFKAVISQNKIAVNLRDNAGRRYLQINGECLYYAYEEGYLAQRQQDPFYQSMLINAISRIGSQKFIEEIHAGPGREQFIEELREAIEPLIFPYHIGETQLPLQTDDESGLKPGISHQKATFRGRFYDHLLKVDAVARTIQLDGGETVTFTGDEEDLKIYDVDGDYLYVDLTELHKDFQGELHVGVHGVIREFIETDYVFQ